MSTSAERKSPGQALHKVLARHRPGLAPCSDSALIPSEVVAVYPHRWAVPRDVWYRIFSEASHEISILAYSSLFLAEDSGLLDVITARAKSGVAVRIALCDPDCLRVAERGDQEGIDDAMTAKIRNALTLYGPLCSASLAEIRLHQSVLYNSIYHTDHGMLANQHVYGAPATNSPVLHLHRGLGSELFRNYAASFGRIWSEAHVLPSSRPSGS